MTNHPTGGGISRRISGEDRDKVKTLIENLNIPEGMSVIIRTAGIDRQIEELNWDLEYLKSFGLKLKVQFKNLKLPN